MNDALVPVIVALIGFLQVGIGLYLGRKNQQASANLDDAGATKAIGETYSELVQRLEERLTKTEEKWEQERAELLAEIERQKAACEERFQELLAENVSLKERVRELESGKVKND